MYDLEQHRELFSNPGNCLFRGALPTVCYPGPYEGIGVKPTSVDPIVASLFACRYRVDGPAVVLIARKADFANSLDGPNLASFAYELAVNLELRQDEFERGCIHQIAIDEALIVLAELGYDLPRQIPNHDGPTDWLRHSPRMLMSEIAEFVSRCDARSG